MKIAMIGSGAAGSVFASYLRKGGADITLVDMYKAHMDKVAKDGMDFCVAGGHCKGDYHLDGFKTTTSAHDVGVADIVIFMTKSTQIAGALETAKPCIGPKTVLVSLMNGLGNEEKIVGAASPDRVLFGSGVLGTALPEPGKCISSPPNEGTEMNFGPMEMGPLAEAAGRHLEKCFRDGGCNADFHEDVRPFLWYKCILNSVFNPLSALLRIKCRDITMVDGGRKLIEQLTHEDCAVAAAMGVKLPIDTETFVKANLADAGAISDYFPSMAQDMLMHQRQTEISTLCGTIVEYGERCGVPTPFNEVITLEVSAIQDSYDKQYKG